MIKEIKAATQALKGDTARHHLHAIELSHFPNCPASAANILLLVSAIPTIIFFLFN